MCAVWFAITACAERPGSDEPAAPEQMLDDFGYPVSAGTNSDPARIVSLSPTTTELLFRLTAGARLVGRTTWDLYPDSARLVTDVGPGLRPNVETVLAVDPDLVILYASGENRAAAEQLRAAGVDVIALRIDSIEDFERAARVLGTATGQGPAARAVVHSLRQALAAVRDSVRGLDTPSVFLHVWHQPLITIGGGSYLDALVTIAGGENVFGDMDSPSPQVSLESVIERDPDVVLAGPRSAARILRDPSWSSLTAARNGRVLVLDTALVGRPSARMGEAAWSIARLLHPELAP